MGRVSGDFSQSLLNKGYHEDILCVSFECDSLSEELERRRKRKKIRSEFLFSGGKVDRLVFFGLVTWIRVLFA